MKRRTPHLFSFVRVARLAAVLGATALATNGPAQTLAGLWRFDDAGSSQADYSTNNHTATTGGNATWVNDTTRNSGVMSFDGNNDFLSVAHTSALAITGDITMAAWINVGTTIFGSNNWRGIMGKGPDSNDRPGPYQWWFNQGNLVPAVGRGNGTAQAFDFADISHRPTEQTWEHWAVTMSGTTVTWYKNGVAVDSGTISTTIGDTGGPLFIGNRPNLGTDFLGRLDDVAIFNGALTGTQVTTIMGGNFTEWGAIPEPSTYALWGGCAVLGYVVLRRRRATASCKN